MVACEWLRGQLRVAAVYRSSRLFEKLAWPPKMTSTCCLTERDTKLPPPDRTKINGLWPKDWQAQVRRFGEKGPQENEKCSRAAVPAFRWSRKSNDSRPF